MSDNQVLIISFWNPTKENPKQGVFIQDQAAAVCGIRNNVIFMQVNILPSSNFIIKKIIKESSFYRNRLIEVNLYSIFWKLLFINPWKLARLLYKIIERSGTNISPKIIHSNVIFPCGIVGYLLSKRMGSALLISEHWSKAEGLLRKPFIRRIALRSYQKCFAIMFVSEFLSRKIISATGHSNPVIISNIIDTEIFHYSPKPEIKNSELCFLCVGSWRPPKRLDLIFRSLCTFAEESGRQLRLRVVGNGPQAERLKKEIIPGNLKIEWLGYQDKPVIAELLHSTHIFIHASDIETFSIVTAEALSTGTPVLASNAGALPELVNNTNGILAENTPEAFLKALHAIVSSKFDNKVIADQQKNKFSPATVGSSIIAVYERAAHDKI